MGCPQVLEDVEIPTAVAVAARLHGGNGGAFVLNPDSPSAWP